MSQDAIKNLQNPTEEKKAKICIYKNEDIVEGVDIKTCMFREANLEEKEEGEKEVKGGKF